MRWWLRTAAVVGVIVAAGASASPSAAAGISSVTAGEDHTCALSTAKAVECWGNNQYGQLGNGQNGPTATDNATPVAVSGVGGTGTLTDVTAIAAGGYHTCALLSSGGVDCWGFNGSRELGNGTTSLVSATPVAVVGVDGTGTLSGVTAITAGEDHTCALLSSGGVDCWGANQAGQLGNGQPPANSSTPVAVVGVDGTGTLTGVTAITAGNDHTCALLSSGGVDCWGDNYDGELGNGTGGDGADSATPVVVVGVGGTRTLTGVTAIIGGNDHTCALLMSGGVDCWGDNDYGQLGNGTTSDSERPVAVLGVGGTNTGVTAITAGGYHTCALLMSGSVDCWGDNDVGELGNGTTIDSSTPVAVSAINGPGTLTSVTAITAGDAHTCAVLSSGGVDCWGFNGYGDLGNGTTTNSSTPIAVRFGNGQTSTIATAGDQPVVADGFSTATVVVRPADADGNVLSSGGDTVKLSSTLGTLSAVTNNGDGTYTATLTSTMPGTATISGTIDGQTITTGNPTVTLTAAAGISSVAAGGLHTCALTSAGAVECWGDNDDGQLGNGTTSASATPVAVSAVGGKGTLTGVTAITAGSDHTCALLSSGGVDCWGDNDDGQLGNGTTSASSTPVAVSGVGGTGTLSGVTAITAGEDYTCALLSSGGVDCWGSNGGGQLGNGTTSASSTPVAVSGVGGTGTLTGVTAITAGAYHTCALLSSGGVDCWGFNGDGELGNGTTGSASPTPVAVVGVDGTGTLTGVTAITAGGDHTCALLSSGGVDCWGYNHDGELGNGTASSYSSTPVAVSGVGGTGTLTGVTAITAGLYHTCALLSSGGVDCWGYNHYGQLGNGTTTDSSTPVAVVGVGGTGTLTGVTAITAGDYHTCAVVPSGGVDCWGANDDGQLGNGTTTDSSTPIAVRFGNGHTSTLTASPASVTADGTSTTTITVQALDVSERTLTLGGDTVTLTSTLGTISGVKDNGDGTYTATLTSGTTTGTATVSGTINGQTITTGNPKVTFTAGAASASQSTITAAPTSVTADGTSKSTIIVQAQDVNGNDETAGGDTVILATTLGSLSGVTDNKDGTYTATLTSSQAGTATVSGTINSNTITTPKPTVTFTAPPATTTTGTGTTPPPTTTTPPPTTTTPPPTTTTPPPTTTTTTPPPTPPGPPAPPVAPSNRFTVTHIHVNRHGRVQMTVTVPGPGRIDLLLTAWRNNLTANLRPQPDIALQPASGRYVVARRHTQATHTRTLTLSVAPNTPLGRALIHHHTYGVVLRLWVSYTPTGGTPHSHGFRGLHVPHSTGHTPTPTR